MSTSPLNVSQFQDRILSRAIRGLALAAGLFSAVAVIGLNWILPIVAVPTVLGAIIQQQKPRAGRRLLYVSLPLLGVMVIPTGVVLWAEMVKGGPVFPYRDLMVVCLTTAWIFAPILVVAANAVLVIEAVQERRARSRPSG